MPWYVMDSPQGQRQLFADSAQRAAEIFFQQTGITASPAVVQGDNPAPGIQFLVIGSGGQGSLNPAPAGQDPVTAERPIGGLDEATRQSFISQFRRAMDVGGQTATASPFRRYLNRQQEPALDVFALQSGLGQTTLNPQQYIGGMGRGQQFGQDLTASAGRAWSELQRQSAQGGPPTAESYLEADPGAATASQIGGVARRAAREKYGVWGAEGLADPDEVYQRYLGQAQDAPGTQNRLIEFLKRAYGY